MIIYTKCKMTAFQNTELILTLCDITLYLPLLVSPWRQLLPLQVQLLLTLSRQSAWVPLWSWQQYSPLL